MEYTGIENIYFYGTLMGFTKKQMDKKLDDIIKFAEIGDYIDQVVKTYSSGMFACLLYTSRKPCLKYQLSFLFITMKSI